MLNPNTKSYFSSILWLFICLAILLFFKKPINELLNVLFVKPIISNFENTRINNLLLVIISLGLAVWLWIFCGRTFLLKLGIVVLIFYLLQRANPFWRFQQSKLFPLLFVWDITAVALILPAFKALSKVTRNTLVRINSEGFVEDLPITKAEDDHFRRRVVAKEIAEKINLTPNQKSFAIGILGEYGSGKTSFINLINFYLDKTKTSPIYFNPWSAESTPNIQKDFFDLLADKLYDLDPQLSGLILSYSRKLSRLDDVIDKAIRKIGFLSNIIQKNSYTTDYERINKLLNESGKKIVVTIDDLDRLYSDEVMEVLRLIRNTASFNNIFYLVAYERSYIEESIKSLNSQAAGSYLDKIIQLEVPLPKRESDDLINFAEELLSAFLTPEHMKALREHIIPHGFHSRFDITYRTVFRQSRDVIKFINNFKISYKLLGDEVMFDNLFVLELLKFRFPLVYDKLYEQNEEIIYYRPTRSSHEEFYELFTYEEGGKEHLKIEKTLRNDKYTEVDIDLICSLLRNLFFKFNRSEKAKNALIYPLYFERYFRYRISGNEISEKKYRESYTGNSEDIKRLIDECEERKLLHELSTRIFQEKTVTREDFEFKIKSIFILGPKFVKQKGNTSFNHQVLLDELWDYDGRISNKYYQKNKLAYTAFLRQIFESAPFPYLFHSGFIYRVKEESVQDISIDREEIVGFQVNYFKKYVGENGLDKNAMWLFWRTKEKYEEPVPGKPSHVYKKQRFEKAIVSAIKALLPIHDLFFFLKETINADMMYDNMVAIHQEILEIFDQPADLRGLIAEHTILAEDLKSDYLSFFDKCQTVNFNQMVEYDFQTALARSYVHA